MTKRDATVAISPETIRGIVRDLDRIRARVDVLQERNQKKALRIRDSERSSLVLELWQVPYPKSVVLDLVRRGRYFREVRCLRD